MLKIRDFARLGEVSMTTLRYYDEIGLLKPIHVDPGTGYRFYTMDQLPRLHRILALKDLGLGLVQIVQILEEGVSPEPTGCASRCIYQRRNLTLIHRRSLAHVATCAQFAWNASVEQTAPV